MTTATGLIDRYQDYRVRRWLVHEQRMAGMLPTWRTRRRRRALVVTVAVSLTALFVTGVLCAFDLQWATLLILPVILTFLAAWTMLRVVSQGQDNAPAEILDELEIAQRTAARSIGLSVTQWLTLPPLFYVIWAPALGSEMSAFQTSYAGGVMILATLLAGGCAPAMILAWTRPEPEPEG
ncbi:hypothetical protein [Nocardia sp. CC201C]|uniref:hypothetical protein n=1 Tax=Nocardia sp. CC201C TaxID=3044575 RepID=UPI0024A9B790|nr:hypothetical protein [Nocardia sp. CC201C]